MQNDAPDKNMSGAGTAPVPPDQPALPAQPGVSRPRTWLIILLCVLAVAVVVEWGAGAFVAGLPQSLFRRPTASATVARVANTATPGQVQVFTPTNAFQAADCPFQLGDGMINGKNVQCGYVTVPENRNVNNGRTVRLAVVIFKRSPSPTLTDPDPVLRLDGGPGGPSLDDWAHYVTSENFGTFVFDHDLIMFDQRGTGHSQPTLNCPEILNLQLATINRHLSAQESDKLSVQAAQACYNRLVRSGIDLNAYNTLEDAADVRDIIHALGYKQMTLYGVSYGTRLALTVMRLYPDVVHAAVLDSVYPPQRNRTDLPSSAQRVFNVLFHGCAIDATCNKKFPALDSVFYKLVQDLNASPISFQSTDPATNKTYTVSFAGDDLVFWLFSALYVTQFIPELPAAIYQVRNHNYTLLSQIYSDVEFDDTFSDGMFYSTTCAEDWAFASEQDIAKSAQGVMPQIQPALTNELQQEYDTCQVWKVRPLPAVQKQAVVSNIPTLVLSGEYDPITPPANGKLTAQTLKNSYYFLFPGMGHGEEYNSPCSDTIISEFEDNPAQKPDSGCLAQMTEPAFQS